MCNVVIFFSSDLGRSYRLLQFAKSFSSVPGSHVFIVGADIHCLPREIENSPNITHKYIEYFRPNPFFYHILYPICLIYYLYQIFFLSISLPSIDLVLCSSENIFIDVFCGHFFKLLKRAKLIIDVVPYKYMKKRFFSLKNKIELIQPNFGDICFVSTHAMQLMLELRNVKAVLWRDSPYFQFTSRNEQHDDITSSILKIDQKTFLIAVPFNDDPDQQQNRMLLSIGNFLNNRGVQSLIILFNKNKSSIPDQFEKMNEKRKQTNTVLFKQFRINTVEYANILSKCNISLIFNGSRTGLDISSELIQSLSVRTPVVVFKFGCVREIIHENENGFFFTNQDELKNIFAQICCTKTIDIEKMRDMMSLNNWECNSKEAMKPIFNLLKTRNRVSHIT